MALLSLLLRRLAHAAGLLFAVVLFNFALIHLAPGDPAQVIAGEMGGANAQILAQLRADYHLNQSFADQLWIYIAHVARGDLGRSYYFNAPVAGLIAQRVPATLLLVGTAIVGAVIAGTLLGVAAARRPNGLVSHVITVLSLVGFSAPVFWTGILLILLFASAVPIFPVEGMRNVAELGRLGWWGSGLDVAYHLVLPATTLGLIYLAQYSRLARASMLEALTADYIRTARAKGLAERLVIYKHALRNAMLPLVTVVGLQFSQIFSGAVLVETVFDWPGLGRLAYDSILRRDSPTILGILLFSALIVIGVNILTDLAYRLVDPRIRSGA
ncbi:MAG TPA: ABC transporter permease [Stellaceae bacterium]|nr:ABC transporter permease [Stellaceae bacterium]